MNCWEFMKCGNEKGSFPCPAYPNYGRTCARVPGTLMGGARSASYAAKLSDCIRCGFYRSEHYNRGYARGEEVFHLPRERPHRLPNA
jgi:hypothetical protein